MKRKYITPVVYFFKFDEESELLTNTITNATIIQLKPFLMRLPIFVLPTLYSDDFIFRYQTTHKDNNFIVKMGIEKSNRRA